MRQVNLFERAASDPQSPRLLVELARRGVAVVAHQSEAAALQSAALAAGAHVEVINRLVVLAADSEAAATASEQHYGPRVI
ncbi:hypothetical protein [Parenemella sanctibonifatiensis]|uniref:Uncharacterized protein n=1 Tax=Parenemella sanctibonifatiensis TaxID=2016505 RepID=A0A255EAM5_9ACTN|nr:hypothetical protein [Parenemella sanctibonifatiensis]OYN88566.1 hypothetical protein CGZ91_13215 [Parenemella sanctibonifatiensis]